MLVTCRQMQSAEQAAFDRGVSAEDLMERAGKGIADVVRQFFPKPGAAVLYLGKGNNAGDALVAGRELEKSGWKIHARLAFPESEFKELPAIHWNALTLGTRASDSLSERAQPFVLLDGLIGIGASGPLSDSLRQLAAEMNNLRRTRHATIIAMDIPSGLDADTGEPCADCIEADITVTIGAVKTGLVADAATSHVGRLALVPLPEVTFDEADRSASILDALSLRIRLPRRAFDFHKGQAGRVGIIAGSRPFSGAGALASMGALHGGAGLVTLLVKEGAHHLIASKCPPEIMVRFVRDYRDVLDIKFDALAIGPGVGLAYPTGDEITSVIREATAPVVVDADALTALAEEKLASLHAARGPRLLTPHPVEMARLTIGRAEWQRLTRRDLAEAFVAEHKNVTLLLKGSRTVIAQSGEQTRFNTTGHPGMATGGTGDVLAGLCAALIGQGMSCIDAASLGAWLSGRAAEIVIANGEHSVESLAASDVAAHLGAAFNDVRRGVW